MRTENQSYILGPCSAESRDQVLETAEAIQQAFSIEPSASKRWVFRAGIWKPRTSPDSFKGAGEAGLEWLQEVKARYGVPVATEVATPEHVQAALEAGIDYLWIGARTSANPIAVDVISSSLSESIRQKAEECALKGLLVKNPVNADANLWLGNIERMERTGKPVAAVHRGCGHKPCWSMAHQVRTVRPDIPMLLDPSHMSGDASKVPALTGKVVELGLDGAMIEVHAHPEQALSDKAQQISPTLLRDAPDPILSRLCLASLICPSDSQQELNWLRAEIDELDERLWDTIASRMDVSRRIGEWKKVHNVEPLQPERYQQIVDNLKTKADTLGLTPDFALRLWDMIHEESVKKQVEVRN